MLHKIDFQYYLTRNYIGWITKLNFFKKFSRTRKTYQEHRKRRRRYAVYPRTSKNIPTCRPHNKLSFSNPSGMRSRVWLRTKLVNLVSRAAVLAIQWIATTVIIIFTCWCNCVSCKETSSMFFLMLFARLQRNHIFKINYSFSLQLLHSMFHIPSNTQISAQNLHYQP